MDPAPCQTSVLDTPTSVLDAHSFVLGTAFRERGPYAQGPVVVLMGGSRRTATRAWTGCSPRSIEVRVQGLGCRVQGAGFEVGTVSRASSSCLHFASYVRVYSVIYDSGRVSLEHILHSRNPSQRGQLVNRSTRMKPVHDKNQELRSHLTQSFFKHFVQTSIPTQILQRILCISNSRG